MSPSHVATLVANPAEASLNHGHVYKAKRALPAQTVAPETWLDETIAVDIPFVPHEGATPRAVEMTILAALAGAPFDVFVQPIERRRKMLFLADMDSTMIGQECIDELADFAGLKERVAAITERAMRGEIAFEPALRDRVACLKGLPVTIVDDVLSRRITLTPGGSTLVRTMRTNGAFTALVSGGFTLFTSAIGARIGFDFDRGNVLDVAEGRFAGTVAKPILGREAKLATLVELRDRLGIENADIVAIGDGANDLPMLAEAGLGVAYRAKPAVAAAADARIEHTDLTALLYAQGYRGSQFVH